MLLLLALSYLWAHATHAAPISASNPTQIMPRATGCDCQNNRSLFDIVWSCLATMFACSWIAMHPNVPAPGDGFLIVAFRRAKLMFWAIMVPELIVIWAMRQWRSARVVKKRFEGYGWTMTHGFFLGMGGFMLCDEHGPIETLTFPEFDMLEKEGRIFFPDISEAEIRDKEKGGPLAKALVVLQTSWFIVQCIARVAQGIGLVELELFTLATAALNGFMYFLWWQKPLDVSYPIPVFIVPEDMPPRPQNGEMVPETSNPGDKEMENGTTPEERRPRIGADEGDESVHGEPAAAEEVAPTTLLPVDSSYPPPSNQSGDPTSSINPERSFRAWVKRFPWNLRADIKTHGIAYSLFLWFLHRPFIRPVAQFLTGTNEPMEGKMRVPTFYSPRARDGDPIAPQLFLLFMSAISGGLHCAAWSFYFPSRTERTLWRSCSIIITAIPFIEVLQNSLTDLLFAEFMRNNPRSTMGKTMGSKVVKGFLTVWTIFAFFLIPVYIVARFLLLFQCLFLLRDLPPTAFQTVSWTRFIPHW